MKEGMPDPLSKATELKQKLEQENQEVEEQEKIIKTQKVKELFKEQTVSKEAFDVRRTGLLEEDQVINSALSKADNDRKELKRIGRKALGEIKSAKGGMEKVRTDPELREEIFADTIKALKDINELKKTGPKQRETIRQSINTLNQSHLEGANDLLETIKEEHPDYIEAKEKVRRYTEAQRQVEEYIDQVQKFCAKYPERLSDQITYDSQNNEPIDITLNQKLKDLDKDIEEAKSKYEKADKEKADFLKTKKGVFEKQSSYDAKRDTLSATSIETHKKYNDLWDEKRVLDAAKYEFRDGRQFSRLFGSPMNFVHANGNEINEIVKDQPTIQVLIERMKELLEKKLEQLKPSEKERTLASLVDLVESKKRVIETRPYHK